MLRRSISLGCCMIMLLTSISAQENNSVDSLLQGNLQTISQFNTPTPYELMGSQSISSDFFKEGNIFDASELLRGTLSGVSIAAPGGDPNGQYYFRLRGLNTLSGNRQPVYIVDGFPMQSLDLVDPNDIAEVRMLKGAIAGIYGGLAGSGVIEITTKSGQEEQNHVIYRGIGSSSSQLREVPVLSAEAYANASGSNDLGSSTNWIDEITRNGLSHGHHLSLVGGQGNTRYRASLNYRNVEGIINTSGFEQFNGRLNLSQKLLNERIELKANLFTRNRTSSVPNLAVVEYAITMNPTAPIFDENLPQYDGYFQQLVFQMANPVALLDQTQDDREHQQLGIQGEVKFNLLEGIDLVGAYYRTESDLNIKQYASKFDLGLSGNWRNGRATQESIEQLNQHYQARLEFDRDIGSLKVNGQIGYADQYWVDQNLYAQGTDFLTDAFTYNNLAAANGFADGDDIVENAKTSHRLLSAFAHTFVDFKGKFWLFGSIRRDGSSRLGENQQWSWFPSGGIGLDLNSFLHIPILHKPVLRASFSETGNFPVRSYQSQWQFGVVGTGFTEGSFNPVYGPVNNPNPNLDWERSREISLGLSTKIKPLKLDLSIDWFIRNNTDLLVSTPVSTPPNFVSQSFLNVGHLRTNGIEASLNHQTANKPNFKWNQFLSIWGSSTEIINLSSDTYLFEPIGIANQGAPGRGFSPHSIIGEGEKVGALWGPVFEGLNSDGEMILRDFDGNGFDFVNDRTGIGNGIPNLEFGYGHQIKWGSFDINVLFRGVLGHDLVNSYRAFYETRVGFTPYNAFQTKNFLPNLRDFNTYSDFYVENASYVSLDNLSIGYDIPFKKQKSSLRIFLAAQNLLLFTGYTGLDPEVRYEDFVFQAYPRPASIGGLYSGNFSSVAAGIERRRSSYFPVRTWSIGVELKLQ